MKEDWDQRRRLKVPTLAEMTKAETEEREIVACSGKRYGPLIYLKLACRNGDIGTVTLSTVGKGLLVTALTALLSPEELSQPGFLAEVQRTDNGCEVQAGSEP